MQSTHRAGMPTNQVVALFADRALSFNLSSGATLADLADRLGDLGQRHIGMPTAIYLKSGLAGQPFAVLHRGIGPARRIAIPPPSRSSGGYGDAAMFEPLCRPRR